MKTILFLVHLLMRMTMTLVWRNSMGWQCPYKHRNTSPEYACTSADFCSRIVTHPDGTENVQLKRNHPYYSQVQGQMAITGRKWCHFIIFTTQGLSVEMIKYDENFWTTKLLPALDGFYKNCVAPEIVCPVHLVGMRMCDLRLM